MKITRMGAAPLALTWIAAALAGCSGGGSTEVSLKPSYIGTVSRITVDGVTDDLLTAGMGRTGLQNPAGATVAPFADPLNPTAAELRRRAIHTNYRALVDTTTAGGYGRLYGPNINAAGVDIGGEGRIAGVEYMAFADDGTGTLNVTVVVQIPSTFDVNNPCIVAAPSSGSRGVYGAIGTAGEWGLKRGCAVAYTDKGTGTGLHVLQTDQVMAMDGRVTTAAAAGTASSFTAPISAAERTAYTTAFPNRVAWKQAHSRKNPEKEWGQNVLHAIEFAFYALNQEYGSPTPNGNTARLRTSNTLTIASSVSNGGGASLMAAELDRAGLIDGVAVGEPQIQPNMPAGLRIERNGVQVAAAGLSLYDYTTIANLYQPCAAWGVAGSPAQAFVTQTAADNRCASLAAAGLVTGSTLAAQQADALVRLRNAGWEPEADVLHASMFAFATGPIAVTYANSYSRARVQDNLCDYSFAYTGASAPAAIPAATLAGLFGTAGGLAGNFGPGIVNINETSTGAPASTYLSLSASNGLADFNLDGARCLRNLWTGTSPQALALRSGVGEVRRNGDLGGKPTLIVHGRDDALIPVNHTSRAYFGVALMRDSASRIRYVEVTNAQHFDAFLASIGGYNSRYVPLHVYFNRAMDAMYDHLKNGTPLPPSQVVRTVPRGSAGGSVPDLAVSNVPGFSASPATADEIVFVNGNTVRVPN